MELADSLECKKLTLEKSLCRANGNLSDLNSIVAEIKKRNEALDALNNILAESMHVLTGQEQAWKEVATRCHQALIKVQFALLVEALRREKQMPQVEQSQRIFSALNVEKIVETFNDHEKLTNILHKRGQCNIGSQIGLKWKQVKEAIVEVVKLSSSRHQLGLRVEQNRRKCKEMEGCVAAKKLEHALYIQKRQELFLDGEAETNQLTGLLPKRQDDQNISRSAAVKESPVRPPATSAPRNPLAKIVARLPKRSDQPEPAKAEPEFGASTEEIDQIHCRSHTSVPLESKTEYSSKTNRSAESEMFAAQGQRQKNDEPKLGILGRFIGFPRKVETLPAQQEDVAPETKRMEQQSSVEIHRMDNMSKPNIYNYSEHFTQKQIKQQETSHPQQYQNIADEIKRKRRPSQECQSSVLALKSKIGFLHKKQCRRPNSPSGDVTPPVSGQSCESFQPSLADARVAVDDDQSHFSSSSFNIENQFATIGNDEPENFLGMFGYEECESVDPSMEFKFQ